MTRNALLQFPRLALVVSVLINESIYERPHPRRVAISPLIRRARKGLVAQFSF